MKKLTTTEFIEKAITIHKLKYDYSLVEYVTAKIKVKIICKEHGVFEQDPDKHLNKRGCPKCKYDKLHNIYVSNLSAFIKKAIEIHGNTYDYSNFIYTNSKTKSIIVCKEHGNFLQHANHHLVGIGCPKCKTSKGELKIEKWLSSYNIKFEEQKKFNDCKNKRCLPFDFYLPDHNICIEFDGEQHYNISRRSKDPIKNLNTFNNIKLHDDIKNNYCISNNISLLRIPYWELKNIDILLKRNISI